MSSSAPDEPIAAIRRFNRFYTQRIGILAEGWAKSRFSLAQARVLYELARREKSTAKEIAGELGMDAGYLSRLLRDFEGEGLIARKPSETDARRSVITLTAKGRRTYAPLEQQTIDDVGAMLRALGGDAQARLIAAMRMVERTLGEPGDAAYTLRPPRAGDYGWIIARHGVLYASEFGWDGEIEALTADIVASFVRNCDPKRERCWIAERGGENIGCVFVVKDSARVARLRLLLVEPSARGLGVGAKLVEECVQFARQAGYRKMTLWTHKVLTAARHIYRKAGFRIVRTWTHDDFGKKLVAETWDLAL